MTLTMRPLPVEKSQGSVSALVARFQTAAAHNAATAQREASRRSSSSSVASSSGAGEGPRVVSAGGWRKSNGEVAPAPTSASKIAKPEGDGDGMEVLEDGDDARKRDGIESSGAAELNVPAGGTKTGPAPLPKEAATTSGVIPKKADARVEKASTPAATPKVPTSPKATKAPPPISTGSPAAKAKTATQTSPKASTSPRQRLTSTSSSAASPKTASSGGKTAPKAGDSSSAPPPSTSPSATRRSGSAVPSSGKGESSSTSTGPAKLSPTTGSSGLSKGPSTSATSKTTATRATISPTTTRSIPKASTALNGTTTSSTPATKPKATPSSVTTTTPKPRPSSTSTPTPKPTANRPPSAFKPTKPLTPSVTGPASSRRPSSVYGQTPPVPLRPQVTGTPSKPTASSLAKARGTPSADSPGTMSLGRPAGKRMSLGPMPSSADRQTRRAGSESPAPSSKVEEGKPQRERVTGSSSMSRLMQGTAASRAKVIEGLPGATSPAKSKVASGAKEGVPKSGSARSLASGPKSPTAAKSVVRQRVVSKPKAVEANPVTTSSKPDESAEADERWPDEARAEEGPKEGKSGGGEQEQAATTTNEPDAEPTAADNAKTGPVGNSPIGRIGLAAVHARSPNGANGAPPPASEIGQHPQVVPLSETPTDPRSAAPKPVPTDEIVSAGEAKEEERSAEDGKENGELEEEAQSSNGGEVSGSISAKTPAQEDRGDTPEGEDDADQDMVKGKA